MDQGAQGHGARVYENAVMKTDLREMFIWTTLIACATVAWKFRPELGVLCSFLLAVAVLARLETVAPSPFVVATALVLLMGAMLLLGYLTYG